MLLQPLESHYRIMDGNASLLLRGVVLMVKSVAFNFLLPFVRQVVNQKHSYCRSRLTKFLTRWWCHELHSNEPFKNPSRYYSMMAKFASEINCWMQFWSGVVISGTHHASIFEKLLRIILQLIFVDSNLLLFRSRFYEFRKKTLNNRTYTSWGKNGVSDYRIIEK